jgi:hypothetical protein
MRAWLVLLAACQGATPDKQVTTLSPEEMMSLCAQQESRHRTFTREEQDKIYCSQRAYAAVTDQQPVDQQRGICERAYAACVANPPPEVQSAGQFKCRNLDWVKKMFTCGQATVGQTERCWEEQDLHARRVVIVDPCSELKADGKDAAYQRYLARYEGPRCAELDAACGNPK